MEIPHKFESPTATGGSAANKDNQPEHPIEDAFANRLLYRPGESLSSEEIAAADDPQELFEGLRTMEGMLENSNIPYSLQERYTPPRELSLMFERARNLRKTIDQLEKERKIKKGSFNLATGEATPTKRRYASLAIRVDEDPVYLRDKEGNYITDPDGRKRQIDTEVKYIFGTSEQRAALANAYERAVTELEIRDILGDQVGLRLNLEFRDNLEGITEMLRSGRMPKIKVDHLEGLFNLPGEAELVNNPENIRLGEQIEEAVFLNLVMLKSGSKQQILDLLARPGAKHLIAKMAKEEGVTYDDWMLKYIGDVPNWVEDSDRTLTTYKEEYKNGKRGLVTRWSNIATYEGGKDMQFGSDKELQFIEQYVGGAVGSVEASWIAATLMRDIGAYASEGYVALPPGRREKKDKDGKTIMKGGRPEMEDIPLKEKVSLKLGEGRYISSDDTGKFMALMFNLKEGLKGRKSGLKDMMGRYPDTAMNVFDWAQVERDDLPLIRSDGTVVKPDDILDGTETKQRRSIWDAWLGTAEQPKKSLLTGEIAGEITNEAEKKAKLDKGEAKAFKIKDPKTGQEREVVVTDWVKEEDYLRLGLVNFKSLERDFHGTFSTMQWLMGNREFPTGIFIDATKTSFRYEDFLLEELKAKWKYIGIAMNLITLTKGSPHLFTDPAGDSTIIQANYFRNLMSARIHSNSFAQGILGMTIKIPNPNKLGSPTVEASAAKLIEMNIEEVLKGSPVTQEDIYARYIDNYVDLARAGTALEIYKFLEDAKFEDQVGRVIGKF